MGTSKGFPFARLPVPLIGPAQIAVSGATAVLEALERQDWAAAGRAATRTADAFTDLSAVCRDYDGAEYARRQKHGNPNK